MDAEWDDSERHSSGDALLRGTVLAVKANYYRVSLDPVPHQVLPAAELLCTRRSRLKKIGQQVMVGDQVGVEEPDWSGQRGAISTIFPRQTEMHRPAVANADQILLAFALAEPELDPYQLSRFLVTAEATGLEVVLVLSKSDLVDEQEQQNWCDRLQAWGYQSLLLSLVKDQGVDQVLEQLAGHLTVISGPSGVGKSSLINRLIPQAKLRVGSVSQWGRGRHTTRHVELFALAAGGLLADSPGFNQPTLTGPPELLVNYFPEARTRLIKGSCQFSNCLHRQEPNCAVRGDWERYPHYLSFLEELLVQQAQQQSSSEVEPTLKRKSGNQGLNRYEPKLVTKKYRRPSRRTEQQALQQLYQEATEP